MQTFKVIFCSLIVSVLLCGCTALFGDMNRGVRSGESSSLVSWLYPKGEIPPQKNDDVPVLNVPLRVGLAFVPPKNNFANSYYVSEAHKTELLAKVRESFSSKPYINHIEIIPQYYLENVKGIDGMQQLARLMNVDVMALVSYDQVVHNFDTSQSLLYWTIVGAYVVEGSKDEVHTFVDLAVIDVNTGKLLLRAPGIDKQGSRSTLVKNAENLRRSREKGFELAMATMNSNLEIELDSFRERIKKDQSVKVQTRSGYGGGSFSSWFGMLIVLCCYKSGRRFVGKVAVRCARVRVRLRQ